MHRFTGGLLSGSAILALAASLLTQGASAHDCYRLLHVAASTSGWGTCAQNCPDHVCCTEMNNSYYACGATVPNGAYCNSNGSIPTSIYSINFAYFSCEPFNCPTVFVSSSSRSGYAVAEGTCAHKG